MEVIEMLFSEIYGSYFNTVAYILELALSGDLTGKNLPEIVSQTAFGESILSIPASLTDGTWPLLTEDYRTPLHSAPTMPLTTLQKQWLKALLNDPRIRLFAPSEEGLEDVEPLYDPDTFVYFDRYTDGDPYEDETYIRCFRCILSALRDKRKLRVRFRGARGRRHSVICIPQRIEYSAKDDKFRLLSENNGNMLTINLARVQSVDVLDEWIEEDYQPVDYRERSLTMLLTNERNALERVMLHFSDLEKETEKLDNSHYRVKVWYKHEDETELLIRILSFGPVLHLLEPETLVKQVRERIERQFALQNSSETANSVE